MHQCTSKCSRTRIKDIGEYVAKEDPDPEEVMKALVQRGLRGQLDLQSLVTGKLQVSFAMHPGSEIYYAGIDKGVTEIPTLPTTMQQLAKTLENIDIKGMAEDIRKTLAAIEKLATSPALAEAVTSLNNTLQDFGKLARNVDGRVGPLTTSIEETMRDTQKLVNNVDAQMDPTFAQLQDTLKTAEAALQNAKLALAGVDDVVGVDSAFMWELNNTIRELQSMARQVNALVSLLQRQPDSIIRGKVSLGR